MGSSRVVATDDKLLAGAISQQALRTDVLQLWNRRQLGSIIV